MQKPFESGDFNYKTWETPIRTNPDGSKLSMVSEPEEIEGDVLEVGDTLHTKIADYSGIMVLAMLCIGIIGAVAILVIAGLVSLFGWLF